MDLISNYFYCLTTAKELHGILSPPEDGGRGVHFLGPVGGLPFPMDSRVLFHMGGVTIRNFLSGTPVLISCPIGKCMNQFCKCELNKLSQRSL